MTTSSMISAGSSRISTSALMDIVEKLRLDRFRSSTKNNYYTVEDILPIFYKIGC